MGQHPRPAPRPRNLTDRRVTVDLPMRPRRVEHLLPEDLEWITDMAYAAGLRLSEIVFLYPLMPLPRVLTCDPEMIWR